MVGHGCGFGPALWRLFSAMKASRRGAVPRSNASAVLLLSLIGVVPLGCRSDAVFSGTEAEAPPTEALVDTSRAVAGSRVTPMQKVLTLLGSMLDKAKEAKHEELVQWTAFGQFCEDTLKVKQAAVDEADVQIELIKANTLKYDAEVQRLGQEIDDHKDDIVDYQGSSKNATAERKLQHADYEARLRDYDESIYALTEAIRMLQKENYKRPQVASLLERLSAAGQTPAAARRAIEVFLARDSEEPDLLFVKAPEAHAYEFQSGDIVALLKELLEKFQDERRGLERGEASQRHAYEVLAQDFSSSVAAAEHEIGKKEKGKAQNKQAFVDAKAQLADVSATREFDAKYLADLQFLCDQKATDFKSREQLRADEVANLEKAIALLSGEAVAGAAQKHLPSLLQRPLALLQRRTSLQSPELQGRAAEILRREAGRIGSHMLSAISLRVRDDPFAKVKKMIQDMVLRLQAEEGEEKDHKEWCDSELGTNAQTRKTKSEEVESLHFTIEGLENRMAVLRRDIAALSKDAAQLRTARADAERLRAAEKARNEDTIADAAGAQVDVGQALKILKEFYGKAGEATVLAQGVRAAPAGAPPIFTAPYRGLQAEHSSVIGFLEVIKSDFERLQKETTAAETAAKSEHDVFLKASSDDESRIESDVATKGAELKTKGQDLDTASNDLELAQSQLDAALTYYDKLKPSCVITSTSSSYSARVARREEEIVALREALSILSGETLADSGPQAHYSSVDGGNRGWDVGIMAK